MVAESFVPNESSVSSSGVDPGAGGAAATTQLNSIQCEF